MNFSWIVGDPDTRTLNEVPEEQKKKKKSEKLRETLSHIH